MPTAAHPRRRAPARRPDADARVGRRWAARPRTRRRAAVIVRKARPFDCVPRYRDRRARRRDVRAGDHARRAARRGGCARRARRVAAAAQRAPCPRSRASGPTRSRSCAASMASGVATEILTRLLVQMSALVCAIPWVRTLELDPVRVGEGRAEIVGARIDDRSAPADRRPPLRAHGDPSVSGRAGRRRQASPTALGCTCGRSVRRMRRSSARSCTACPSRSRYFRFFYQLHELTPAMLARFTQVDYDREMALVAVDESGAAPAIVGVARYIMHRRPEIGGVRRRRRRRVAGTRRRAAADDAARGLRQGARARAPRGSRAAQQPRMLKFTAAFGSTQRRPGRSGAGGRDDPAVAARASLGLRGAREFDAGRGLGLQVDCSGRISERFAPSPSQARAVSPRLRGSSAASPSATGGAACAAPSPRSAGCARA